MEPSNPNITFSLVLDKLKIVANQKALSWDLFFLTADCERYIFRYSVYKYTYMYMEYMHMRSVNPVVVSLVVLQRLLYSIYHLHSLHSLFLGYCLLLLSLLVLSRLTTAKPEIQLFIILTTNGFFSKKMYIKIKIPDYLHRSI